jgi:hypothetical protein
MGVGLMEINHTTDPPTFRWTAEAHWEAVWCAQCNEDPEICEPLTLGVGWTDIQGEVTEGGNAIRGSLLDLETGAGYSFEFTRGGGGPTPPTRPTPRATGRGHS